VSHKTSRNRQRQVECAAEHFLRVNLGCVNTVRAMKTRFVRQDLFACDVLGKGNDGSLVGMQVTCGDHTAVRARRRKIEAVAWSRHDSVLLGEFRSERVGRSRENWFRMHQFENGEWTVWPDAVPVPKEWFKAWKPDITPSAREVGGEARKGVDAHSPRRN
jgi:hypothetical protein